jgi:hypothetical protein
MSAAVKSMTLAEFLVWEEQQEQRYEFDGKRPVLRTDGNATYARIQQNLIDLMHDGIRGHGWRAYGSSLKIQVARSIRYPAAFVVSSPVPMRATVVHDPVVVFEIVRPEERSAIDLFRRDADYRDTPSILYLVLLRQSKPRTIVWAHRREGWVGHPKMATEMIELPEIGLSLAVADLYDGVTFMEQAGIV